MSMFGRDDKPAAGGPPKPEGPAAAPAQPAATRGAGAKSIISPGLAITGNLESAGEVEIGGTVEGDIRAQRVAIEDQASVKGAIYAENVTLSGSVEGRIEARHVSITSSGRLAGDVVHEKLEIEAGAHIDGHFQPTFGKSKSNVMPLSGRPADSAAAKEAKPEAPKSEAGGKQAGPG